MGVSNVLVAVMQFLILSSVLVAAQAQLVVYPNGAVAPFDPNNAAATKEHFAALAEAGSVVNPYTTHAQDLAVTHLAAPAPLYYSGFGKRSAEPQVLGADGLVTYPNGAVAPFDPNVAVATAQHYAAKAAHGSWVPLAGAANVHPPHLLSMDVRSVRLTPSCFSEPSLTPTHTASLPWLSTHLSPIPTVPWSPWSPRML